MKKLIAIVLLGLFLAGCVSKTRINPDEYVKKDDFNKMLQIIAFDMIKDMNKIDNNFKIIMRKLDEIETDIAEPILPSPEELIRGRQ